MMKLKERSLTGIPYRQNNVLLERDFNCDFCMEIWQQ